MSRTGLGLALAAAVVLAQPVGAAPKPQLVDPKGDYPASGADLVSALFTTQKGKVVVVVEFAGAPNAPVPFAYQLRFTTDEGCNWRGHYFGSTGEGSGGCTGSDASPPAVKLKGNTMTFTMAAKGALKPGTELIGIAFTSTPGGVLAGTPGGDEGRTETTYTVGK
ncbi:MAG TPA: hypothetical protein VNA12_00700 [Mycobacteriales bacterium]|nr:hypothetical protein [Mycobacteriales bacterium]